MSYTGQMRWQDGYLYGINPASGQWEPLSDADYGGSGEASQPNNAGELEFRGGPGIKRGVGGHTFLDKAIPALAFGFATGGLGYGAAEAAGLAGGAAGAGSLAGDASLAGGGEVGSGYAASAPGTLGAVGDSAGYVGTGADAMTGGSDVFDLGGGLTVDEYGNTTGGLFQGGPGTPGAGDFAGSGGTWDDIINYAKKAGGNIPGGLLAGLLRGAPGVAGAIGASKQADSYKDLAEKYMNFGAPSRARYESSFAPGFTMENDPGYKDALGLTTKEFLHKASIGGNPADSPNAWMQTLSDVNSKFAYPALQDYRRTNMAGGGLATLAGAAPSMDTAAVNANKGIYDAVGATAADIFTPRQSLADLIKAMR